MKKNSDLKKRTIAHRLFPLMSAAHTEGSPIIRPLFYDFPEDGQTWSVEDAYMFGPEVLVAPILFEGQRTREAYLPAGARWISHANGEVVDGGHVVNQSAPLDQMPVFFREDGSAWSLLDKSNHA